LKTIVFALVFSLAVSWLTVPWVRRLAVRCGVVDKPGERRMHREPMPRWGGIAIWLGVMAGVAAAAVTGLLGGWFSVTSHVVALLGGATLVAIVGLLDDRYDLSAAAQAGAVLLAAVLVAHFGVKIDWFTNPLTGRAEQVPALAVIPVTALWLFFVTKTVDLIDGLDGLAAGVCAIASLALVAMSLLMPIPHVTQPVAVVCAAVAGASMGFLRMNYPPAKIIMGTVGAQFMGFIIAGAAVIGAFKMAAAFAIIVPIFALGVPIFDALFAVVRRAASGQKIYAPDRGHIHHRLIDAGLTTSQAVLIIYAATLVLSVGALVIATAVR